MQTVGEVISAVLVSGPMSSPSRLLTELTEQPEDKSANVGKDRAGSPQPGSWGGVSRCPPIIQLLQPGHGCWDEADGVTATSGLAGAGTGRCCEEGEDDTGHEGLQHLPQAWDSVNVAANLADT